MRILTLTVVASAVVLSGCTGWGLSDFVNGEAYPPGVCGWDYSTVTEKGKPMVGKDGVTIFYDDQSTIVRTAIPCTDTPPKPPKNPVCTVNCDPIVVPECTENCDSIEQVGGNPGNGKPVGGSPWDGITGNSHKNDTYDTSPQSKPMDGQRNDEPFAQPGGKGNQASNANK